MQMSIRRIPDSVTRCVLAAMVIDIIAALALVSAGAPLPALIALALAVLVYWFVYRNLAENIAAAWVAGVITVAVHAAFALVWLLTEDPDSSPAASPPRFSAMRWWRPARGRN